MGTTEVIDERRQTRPNVFTADYRRVMSGAVQRAMDHADRPMDSGYGYEDPLAAAKREALGRAAIPPGFGVKFIETVSYSGTEPIVEAVAVHPPSDYADRPVDV